MYWYGTKHPEPTFSVNSAKKSFTEKSFLRARIQVIHKTFQFICNICKFQKKTKGYINKHILWLVEG